MIIMGLDPASTRNMGLSVTNCKNNTLELIHGETVVFPNCDDGERLRICYDTIIKTIDKYNVEIVCIERSMGGGLIFVRNNIIEMAAIIKMATFDKKKIFAQISPSHLKKIITGSGKAKKGQLQTHIRNYFKIAGKKNQKSEHEYDAMGLALCHAIDIEQIKGYIPIED